MSAAILMNGRCLHRPITGVERYASEVSARLHTIRVVGPSTPVNGVRGHAWEQCVLPRLVGRHGLLWSPANTGPIAVSRQVVTIHDVSPLDHPEWFRRSFVAWYRLLLPALAVRVRRIITDSSFSKARIIDRLRVPADRVICIPCGVGTSFEPAASDRIAEVRCRHGLERPFVLAVGSLQPRKNLARLCQAWQAVRRRHADHELVVIGSTRSHFRSAGLDSTADDVRLLGPVDDDDLAPLYSAAVCAVLPSLYEGFGLTALEAMACGTPVIVGASTAVSEFAAGAALEVDAHSAESIAEGLDQLLADAARRSELAARGRQRARPFTWERTADQVGRVLTEEAND